MEGLKGPQAFRREPGHPVPRIQRAISYPVLLVTERYVRAFPGGTGDVKPAGNYAPALLADKEARDAAFSTVLWLDAREGQYVEECGVMNVFFVLDDRGGPRVVTRGSLLVRGRSATNHAPRPTRAALSDQSAFASSSRCASSEGSGQVSRRRRSAP